jgi:hypothetical protein
MLRLWLLVSLMVTGEGELEVESLKWIRMMTPYDWIHVLFFSFLD